MKVFSLQVLLISLALSCGDTDVPQNAAFQSLSDAAFQCPDAECVLLESNCGCVAGGQRAAAPPANASAVQAEIDSVFCNQAVDFSPTCAATSAACVEGSCQLIYPDS